MSRMNRGRASKLARLWFCGGFFALTALFLSASGARADLPNQGSIDKALNEMTEAEQQARDNIPGNARIKDAEDALDRAKRANEDTPNDNPNKAAAENAEAAAQAAADAIREDMKERSNDDQKERAKNYRKALDERRAARKKLQALLVELRDWLRNRRGGVGGTKEIEDAINRLRPRVGQSETLVTPQSTAALMPLGSMMANIATDSQTHCTFGNGASTPIAYAPADDNGNPLTIGKALASLPLMGPGGVKVPANSGNPDQPPKADKPQGPATSTPQNGPAAQGPATSTPPTNQAGSGASTSAPQPEKEIESDSGGRGLGPGSIGLGQILFGGERGGGMTEIPPPPAPGTPPPAGTTVAESDSILSQIEDEEKVAKEFAKWIRDRQTFAPGSFDPPPTGMTPMEQFMLYHRNLRHQQSGSAEKPTTPSSVIGGLPVGLKPKGSGEFGPTSPGASLEPVPTPGSGPQLDPEMLKKPWERDHWPTPPWAGQDQKSVGDKSSPNQNPASGVQSSPQSKAIDKSASNEPISKPPGAGPATQPIASSVVGGSGVSAPLDPNSAYAGNITLHVKATESVLQAGSHGADIKALFVKMVTTAPDVPKAGRTKTEKALLDKGHDQGVVGCVVEKDGQCKAKLPASAARDYGLDAAGPNIRVDLSVLNNTGGVIHKTAPRGGAAPIENLLDAPAGAYVKTSEFKIGKETFTRVSIAAIGTVGASVLAKLGKDLGAKVEVDHCGEKKPGPPMGMEPVSYSALNSELPQTTIALRGPASVGANAR